MTGDQHSIPADLQALHGTTAEVEQVTVTEDADGIPAFIKVDRELAGVVIVPSLLVPRTPAACTLLTVNAPRQRHQEGIAS